MKKFELILSQKDKFIFHFFIYLYLIFYSLIIYFNYYIWITYILTDIYIFKKLRQFQNSLKFSCGKINFYKLSLEKYINFHDFTSNFSLLPWIMTIWYIKVRGKLDLFFDNNFHFISKFLVLLKFFLAIIVANM